MADAWLNDLKRASGERQRGAAAPRRPATFPLIVAAASAGAFATPFALDGIADHAFRTPPAATVTQAAGSPLPAATRRAPLPVCSGGDRAARRLTCIVDGDTGWERGEKWRMEGIDAPELSKPECLAERAKALAATDRLRAIMANGYALRRGGRDRSGRTLVTVTLADGRDAGRVLMTEGLAQPWPNRGNVWCGR